MKRHMNWQAALAETFALVLLIGQGALADVVKVYWTARDNADVNVTTIGGGTTPLVTTGFSRLQDIDLDSSTGTLYFCDWGPVGAPGNQGSINKINRDGTGLALVLGGAPVGDAIHQLAIDEAAQIIYFTQAVSYDLREISRVGTNGMGYTVLFGGSGNPPGWFYSGLAVDTVNSKLYWGDIGVTNYVVPHGAVNVMGTNGSTPTQLVPHVDGRGRGFALHQ